MSSVPHILCLGGGYVAAYLVKALRSRIRSGKTRLTVVDQNNFHCFHGLVPEMLVGKVQPGNVLSLSRDLFAPADFLCATVEEIDLSGRQVCVSRKLDGRRFQLSYDHLVLAFGQTDDSKRFPGIAEHTFRLRSYSHCFRLRNHLARMLELAALETDPEERRRLLTFVVAGGNYAGVEVVSELSEYLPTAIRERYPQLKTSEVGIHLIHGGEHILPELGARFPAHIGRAESHLKKHGVTLHLKTRLQSASPSEAILNTGERLASRTIVSCTGSSQNPLLEKLGLPRHEDGRLSATPELRVPGHDNLWTAGDCAAVPRAQGGFCPPLAIWAMMGGREIGRNLLRHLDGTPLRPFRFPGLGDACSLAHRRAVGHLKGVPIKGLFAWVAWRFFMVRFVPLWERRFRVVFDWMLGPFFGPDQVDIQTDEPLRINRQRFQPGQDIVKQGDLGLEVFLILQGDVEILREGEGVIGRLSAGDHFGEGAVFQGGVRSATVRAATPVEVIALHRDTAAALAQSRMGAGLHVQPTLRKDG